MQRMFTLAPIWFPHWPAWMWTISRMVPLYDSWGCAADNCCSETKSASPPSLMTLGPGFSDQWGAELRTWTNQRRPFELDKAVEAEPGPGRMSRAWEENGERSLGESQVWPQPWLGPGAGHQHYWHSLSLTDKYVSAQHETQSIVLCKSIHPIFIQTLPLLSSFLFLS